MDERRTAGTSRASDDERASVLAARRRPIEERLALALGWNELASQLREGLRKARERQP